MAKKYDVIVVGARCAGSPTAMLLARAGQRVLLVDRASFPSDTVSTHMVHATGIEALSRWGLADELAATGCPPIREYSFNFGPFTVAASPLPMRPARPRCWRTSRQPSGCCAQPPTRPPRPVPTRSSRWRSSLWCRR